MTSESLHISERIHRPADEVYAYAADPANLPEWAPGLGTAVENVDGQWFVDTPMGRVGFAFVERNGYGVLDHEVTLPSGEVIYNPMRVIRTEDGCEAVFTLRRRHERRGVRARRQRRRCRSRAPQEDRGRTRAGLGVRVAQRLVGHRIALAVLAR